MKSLELNVRLYPWFRAAADGHAWITVFFFYMNQYLSLFVLEVRSGCFSDRIGRRVTLLIAFSGRIQRELKTGEVRT